MLFRTALILTATFILSGVAASQSPDATGRVSIQIGAQNLDSALQTLGRLKQLRIVFVSEDVANLKTPGLKGKLTGTEALQTLLSGTGLTFQFLDARTVSIIPVGLTLDQNAPPASAARIRRNPAENNVNDDAAALAELTVTADRLQSESALKAEVYRFVNSYSRRSVVNTHLARWYEPVRPQTSGLSPELNAFVSARIKEIANNVGTPVGTAKDCKLANVEIMFTTEPQKLMNDVAKRFQGLLGFPYQARVTRLATVARPIQSWYATATRSGPTGATLAFSRDWRIDHASQPDPSVKTGTRLPATVVTALINVLVVADFSKVANQRPEALADYIAMLALSRFQPTSDCDDLPSVSQMMSPACGTAQMSLTPGDTAYLKGLYSVDLGRPIQMEIADIADRMFRDLSDPTKQAPAH
jgi:hypothetical protein